MEQEQQEYKLSMATLNGIIIALIGILVLVTPMTTDIPAEQLKWLYIAGGILTLGGIVTVAFGLRKKK